MILFRFLLATLVVAYWLISGIKIFYKSHISFNFYKYRHSFLFFTYHSDISMLALTNVYWKFFTAGYLFIFINITIMRHLSPFFPFHSRYTLLFLTLAFSILFYCYYVLSFVRTSLKTIVCYHRVVSLCFLSLNLSPIIYLLKTFYYIYFYNLSTQNVFNTVMRFLCTRFNLG